MGVAGCPRNPAPGGACRILTDVAGPTGGVVAGGAGSAAGVPEDGGSDRPGSERLWRRIGLGRVRAIAPGARRSVTAIQSRIRGRGVRQSVTRASPGLGRLGCRASSRSVGAPPHGSRDPSGAPARPCVISLPGGLVLVRGGQARSDVELIANDAGPLVWSMGDGDATRQGWD